jgi:hypothetical protein
MESTDSDPDSNSNSDPDSNPIPAYLRAEPPRNARIFPAYPQSLTVRMKQALIKTYRGMALSFQAFKSSKKIVHEFYQSLPKEDKIFLLELPILV